MLDLRGEAGAVEVVGRYRIVLPLGQGGTADVHLAVAEGPSGFTKLVVVKVLRKNLASDEEFRQMFLSEARLAARLHHPNVVQTNEVIEVDGAPVLVMEYLDGQPFSQVIVRGKQGGFTLAMLLRVIADALAGLHAAHELADFDGTPLGVVHRDVSPHNLFVTVEGHAKVLDFGIAKLERSLVETEVGMVKGKLRYMAPEQVAGDKLDRRADVYAAGVILWEALTGERMWKASSEPEIRARVLAGDLPMPEIVRPEVPARLARICRRALSRAPGDRHATARELADDLEAAMSELGMTVSHREIGDAVARLFADVRAETKRAIEAKLGRASMTTGMTAVTDTGETRVAAARPRRLTAILGLTLGVASLIGLVMWRVAARRAVDSMPRTEIASPSIQAPAPAAPAAKPQTSLTATSPDATTRPRSRRRRRRRREADAPGHGEGDQQAAGRQRLADRRASRPRTRGRRRARPRNRAPAGLRAPVLRRFRRHQEVPARMHVNSRRAHARPLLAPVLAFSLAAAPATARAADAEAAPAPIEAAPPSAAEAADTAKAECLAKYEAAQVARRERRLLDSRAALRICSGAACPAAVRADCVDWLDQVAHSLPSVVVTARARGGDVLAVKVYVDGKLAAERLTGFALELDPGLHKFRFESPPWPVIEREVLASEGVKDKPIEVEFAPPLPSVIALSAHPEPRPFRLEQSDYLFGGVALAGFATLAFFGGTGLYDAHHLETTCGSYCAHDDVQAVRTKLVIADIGLAVGIVALAVGLYLHGKGAF